MSKRTKLIIAIFSVLFLINALIIGSVIYIKSSLKPTTAFLNGEVCSEGNTGCTITPFVVEEGSTGQDVLNNLAESNIIRNANTAYYWNRIIGGYSFKAGYFEIPHTIENSSGVHNITLDEIMAFLADSDNAHQETVWVSLDEGDFARDFAYDLCSVITLKENPTDDVSSKVDTLLAYWNDEEVVRSYMDEYPFLTEDMFNSNVKILLEGYLFPDTYEFYEFSSCDDITRRLLDPILDIYNENIDKFTNPESGLSVHEIFTLASICQWESGSYYDSQNIAGAILNRIENPDFQGTGGKLQSTVTACYAFDLTFSQCADYGDNEEYTQREDVYNTYTIEGFPPGPVCNPSKVSLLAALNPIENNYYFWSADLCNGGTAFATTYAQHLVNVEKYYVACSD